MTISGIAGVSWPWAKRPEFVYDDDVVYQAIDDILFTAMKNRKMNVNHGSEVNRLVFENKGVLLQSLGKREISIALAQHLPGVVVLNIDVEESEKDTGPVTIKITYRYQGLISTAVFSASTF